MEHFLHNLPTIIMTIFLFAFAAFIYFIPTLISFGRGHAARHTVFWLNLVLGWCGIVWVGLLIWAIVTPAMEETASPSTGPSVADPPRPKSRRVSDPITERGHPYL